MRQFSISGRLDDLVVSEFEAPSFSKWGRAQNLSCVQVFWLRKNGGIIYIFLKDFALALVLKQRLWTCRKWPFCLRLIVSSNAIWFSCLPMHVSPMRCYSKLCLPQNNTPLFKICIYIYFFFARNSASSNKNKTLIHLKLKKYSYLSFHWYHSFIPTALYWIKVSWSSL